MKKINISGQLLTDENMARHTSFRIGGKADYYYIPETFEDIEGMLSILKENETPPFIIGSGSNILISDKGIRGCVIDLKNFADISIRGVFVSSYAGANIHRLIKMTSSAGLSGFENLAGIPGTVGGCIAANAGSYGSEIGSVIEWVDYFTPEGKLKRLWKDAGTFSYRNSPFSDTGNIIFEAGFRLQPENTTTILKRMEKVRSERVANGHYSKPSAGSIFKNPVNLEITAGELIDSLQLKGYASGDAEISPKHGNIIINNGSAAAQDVLNLIRTIEEKVKDETGIELEREIRLIGEWQV
ncbi:MAG: UDP-N-acetylmuramate dehydrogenase [Spirochaetia bacterium]|nr:UDP-N-acetylmuramate dehydrogenase [Spirochaetia bacterium]